MSSSRDCRGVLRLLSRFRCWLCLIVLSSRKAVSAIQWTPAVQNHEIVLRVHCQGAPPADIKIQRSLLEDVAEGGNR